jgi:hypothetical protein
VPSSTATMSPATGTEPSWTPGERRVLGVVAARKGWEWTFRNARRILEEARMIEGDLENVD